MIDKVKLRETEHAHLASLVARGLSQREIGRELGISQTNTRHKLGLAGLATKRASTPPRPRLPGRKPVDLDSRVLQAGPSPFVGGLAHPVTKGDRSENAMIHLLRQAGFGVLTPTGIARYDFAIDDGTALHRVQCKTGRLRNGAVCFMGQSINPQNRKTMRYTGQVEYFAVWCEELSAGYLVPIQVVSSRTALYVDAPASRQTARMNFADWYRVRPRT